MADKSKAPEKGIKRRLRTAVAGLGLVAVGSFPPKDGSNAGMVSHDPTPSDNPPAAPVEPGVPLSESTQQSGRSVAGTVAPENSAEQTAERQIGTLIDVSAEYLANNRLEYVLNDEQPALVAVPQNFVANQNVKYSIPLPQILIATLTNRLDSQRQALGKGDAIGVNAPQTTPPITVSQDQDGMSERIAGSPDTPLMGKIIERIDFGPENGETYKQLAAFLGRTDEQIKSVNTWLDSLPEFRDLKDVVTIPVKDAKSDLAAGRALDDDGLNTFHRLFVLKPEDRKELMLCLDKRKQEIDAKKKDIDQKNYGRAASILKRLANSAPMDDVTVELVDAVRAYPQAIRRATGHPTLLLSYKDVKDHITEAQYDVLQRLNEPQLTILIDGVDTRTYDDIVADMRQKDAPQTLVAPYDLTIEMFDRLAQAQLPETFSNPVNVALVLDLLRIRQRLEEMRSREGNMLAGIQTSPDGKHNYLLIDITPPSVNVEEIGKDGEKWRPKMNRLMAQGSVFMQCVTGKIGLVGGAIGNTEVGDEKIIERLKPLQAALASVKRIGDKDKNKDNIPHPPPTQRRLAQTFAGWEADGLKILSTSDELSSDIQQAVRLMPLTNSISVSPITSPKHTKRAMSGKTEGVAPGYSGGGR